MEEPLLAIRSACDWATLATLRTELEVEPRFSRGRPAGHCDVDSVSNDAPQCHDVDVRNRDTAAADVVPGGTIRPIRRAVGVTEPRRATAAATAGSTRGQEDNATQLRCPSPSRNDRSPTHSCATACGCVLAKRTVRRAAERAWGRQVRRGGTRCGAHNLDRRSGCCEERGTTTVLVEVAGWTGHSVTLRLGGATRPVSDAL